MKHLERTIAKAHCSGVGTALGSPARVRDANDSSVVEWQSSAGESMLIISDSVGIFIIPVTCSDSVRKVIIEDFW